MKPSVAVVTGASGGIGAEICKILVGRGVRLILIERKPEAAHTLVDVLNRSQSGAVLDVIAADLARHSAIRTAAAAILTKHPQIDFLFNNAGVLTESLQFSPEHNELHFEINALAALQLIDQLRPALAAGRARIVSTSAGIASGVKHLDLNDLVAPQEFKKLFGPYVQSKQALNVLTAALAPELLRDSILIRTADPGPTRTRLTRGGGTPLWMRMFSGLLPGPDKAAAKITGAALDPQWGAQTGLVIVGGKSKALPPELADAPFQAEFLARCRERIAAPSARLAARTSLTPKGER